MKFEKLNPVILTLIISLSFVVNSFCQNDINDKSNATDTTQIKAQDHNATRSNIGRDKASPNDRIDNPKPTDLLQVKANHNTTRSNQAGGIKEVDSNNPTPTDSLQVKANPAAGSHTNPYFVSNELAGDMVEPANNSSSNSNSSFDASKIKEVKKESDLKGRNIVLYRNGKQYYYNASKEKVRAILKSFENDPVEKATGCPPPGMEGAKCTSKNGFCWCYLGRDNEKK